MNCKPPGSSVHGDSPGKNTGVGCHALLQGIFSTQELNPCLLCLLHCQMSSLPLVLPGNPPSLLTTCQIICRFTTILQRFTFKRSFSIKFYLGDVVAVVQLLSCVQLFATPWTAARFTITWSLLKLMFIELMMLAILCHHLLFLPSIVPSIIKVFSNESVLHIRWPKYWSFSILPVNIQD